jgi:glycosyltransferase involved in cell wall biosynthesis
VFCDIGFNIAIHFSQFSTKITVERNNMRIAIATDLSILGRGGLEALVRELASGLSRYHEVILVSGDDPGNIQESFLSRHVSRHIHIPDNSTSPEWIRNFSGILHETGVDICHFHLTGTYGWNSGISSHSPIPHVAESGIRCFTTNHQAVHPFDLSTTEYSSLRRLLGYLKRLPSKTRCIHAVEREFLVSNHDLNLARTWYPHVAHKFARIYHSCLSDAPPTTDEPKSRIILNLGTVCYRKGQHILAKSFARIAHLFPEWKLRLVGQLAEQACINEIRACAEATGLQDRIELHGPTSDPAAAIQECEIYVQPSLLEGLGLSLQEAMFHGRACIGSNVGGIPELIDENLNGLLVPPDNTNALAAMLEKLMTNNILRKRLAASAKDSITAKGMTREAMLSSYLSIYEQH